MDALTPLPRHDPVFLASSLSATLRASGALDTASACLCQAAALLVSRTLRFDAADPQWPDRDRLLLSSTLSPLAAALTALCGADESFATTMLDPPGQSLGAALGAAMAERALAARFGRSLIDHRTWVLATLADLETGLGQEAAAAAGAQRLGRLAVIAAIPDGQVCPPGLASTWTIRQVRSDDVEALQGAISAGLRSHKPTLIACTGDIQELHANIDERNETDDAAGEAWQLAGSRGASARRAWLRRLARHTSREEFDRTLAHRMPPRWHSVLSEPGPLLAENQSAVAPIATCRQALVRLAPILPELVSLPHEAGASVTPATPYIQGHARACALAGMTLHGGLIPLGHTRLSEIEGLGPALRTAAQANLRVIHVVVEPEASCPTAGHRAALRAMRNVFVFRPADASETLESIELALRRTHGPSVLMLSEVPFTPLLDRPTRSRCVHGGFLVREPRGRRDVTLIASGAELAITLQAQEALGAAGVGTAVVSLPCWELFANQERSFRDQVLGTSPRIGIEAGSGFGWERWLGSRGAFIGSEDDRGACSVTIERIMTAAREALS